jgi:AraC-like DNA-binding protein
MKARPPLVKSLIIDLAAHKPVLPTFPTYGICVLESHHAAEFQMRPSTYDFHEVMLILGGSGWLVHQRTRHPLLPYHVITTFPGATYHFEDAVNEPLSMLCLCIRPNPQTSSLLKKALPRQIGVLRKPAYGREVAAALRIILYEQSRGGEWEETQVLAHTALLLVRLARQFKRQNCPPEKTSPPKEMDLLMRVHDYVSRLEGTFFDSEKIDVTAARLGMSSRSFTKHFRAITGMSRLRYINELRIHHALFLLQQAGHTVASVAFACGFEDLSTFYRAFRSAQGTSPLQWLERQRPSRS